MKQFLVLIKLLLTCANFGFTSLNNALFINPILHGDRCNFDIIFRRSMYVTAICLGKLLITDKFAINNLMVNLSVVPNASIEIVNESYCKPNKLWVD